MIHVLGSIVNIIWGGGVWPFNEHESLHFDNKQDIHICSVYYEERVYAVDLELLAISY